MALMRNQNRRRRAAADIPVASFSDIAFLLIIFFVIATTLVQPMGVTTELPSGERSEQEAEEKTNIVNIHDQQISFNDTRVNLSQLQTRLSLLRLNEREDQDRIVLLEATGHVPYQLYYEVMIAITNAGGVIGIVREAQ